MLVIATDVDAVYTGWGTPEQAKLGSVTVDEVIEMKLPAGSMGPKAAAAAASSPHATGHEAVIGSLADIDQIARAPRERASARPEITPLRVRCGYGWTGSIGREFRSAPKAFGATTGLEAPKRAACLPGGRPPNLGREQTPRAGGKPAGTGIEPVRPRHRRPGEAPLRW